MEHTKGKFYYEKNQNITTNCFSFFTDKDKNNYEAKNYIGLFTSFAPYRDKTEKEMIANLELIADAFNIANESGLTPSQLWEKVKELESEIQSMHESNAGVDL
jgi:hypothetical protein